MRSILVATAMLLASGTANADNPDPMSMGREAFMRELDARFHYPPPSPAPAVANDRENGQIADAAYFAHFLDYDRSYAPSARLRAQALIADLQGHAGNMSHEQFVLRVAEIAALADNGHTSLDRNAFMKNTPRIPLRTYLFADGLRVLYSNAANADLLGARIDSIDEHDVENVYRVIRRYRGGAEAFRRVQLIPMLESPGLLQAAGVARERSALTLRGVLANGAPFQRRIEAEERNESAWVSATARLLFPDTLGDVGMQSFLHQTAALPISLRGHDHVFWSEPLANGLYVRLDHNMDADEGPIAPFLANVLARLRADHPTFVVLDMRMNGGGDYTTTYDFAHTLPQAAATARIYVLTSPWTFSAAITTVAGLKEAGGDRVAIVGENVGDRLDFWAEGRAFELPNAFLRVGYSTARHIYDGPCADTNTCFWLNYRFPVRVRTLAPDINAPLTFSAYRQNRDPALEAVLALEARSGSTARMH